MKLLSIQRKGVVTTAVGVGERILVPERCGLELDDVVLAGPHFLDDLRKSVASGDVIEAEPGTFTVLAPLLRPPNIIAIRLNYRDHAAEASLAPPAEPMVFSKFRSAIRGARFVGRPPLRRRSTTRPSSRS